jgi:hypothetical protein
MKKLILLAVTAAALAISPAVQAAGSVTVNEAGFSRSTIADSGANAGIPVSITNGVNKLVTNHVFKVPHGVPVTFSFTVYNSAASNITFFADVSTTGTNDADYTTTAPFVWRFATTSAARYRPATNITAAALGAVRYIRLTSISNDSAAGASAHVTLNPSNATFSASTYNPNVPNTQ